MLEKTARSDKKSKKAQRELAEEQKKTAKAQQKTEQSLEELDLFIQESFQGEWRPTHERFRYVLEPLKKWGS